MAKTALVIPGGGMRNAFVSGALEGSGLRPGDVDAVFAYSSGALAAAYFLAGQNAETERGWIKQATRKDIFDWKRMLMFRSPADLDALVDKGCQTLNYEALAKAPAKLVVTTVRLSDGKTLYHEVQRANARKLLKATCALPLFVQPVQIEEELHADGGIEHALLLRHVYEAGYERILILENQSWPYVLKPSGKFASWLVLSRSQEARRAFLRRAYHFKQEVEFVRRPPEGVKVLLIAPETKLPVNRFTRSRRRVRLTYEVGRDIGEKRSQEILAFVGAHPVMKTKENSRWLQRVFRSWFPQKHPAAST